MSIRLWAASFVVAIAVALAMALAPIASSARPAGIAGGHAFPSAAFHARAFHHPLRPFHRHERFSRFGDRGLFPYWPGPDYDDNYETPFYYPPSDPYGYPNGPLYPPLSYPPPPSPSTAERVYVVPYRPGCDTERVQVPSERDGGFRRVTIVRC